MELEIGKKTYELQFGLSFINEMDNLYTQNMNGIDFGMGLEMMQAQIEMKRPTVLLNVIKAGTSHLNSKPSNKAIEEFLEGRAINDELGELFDEVKKAAEQAPFLKQALQQTKPKK